MIVISDAIANPRAVMVHSQDALLADWTVVSARRSEHFTCKTISPVNIILCHQGELVHNFCLNSIPSKFAHMIYVSFDWVILVPMSVLNNLDFYLSFSIFVLWRIIWICTYCLHLTIGIHFLHLYFSTLCCLISLCSTAIAVKICKIGCIHVFFKIVKIVLHVVLHPKETQLFRSLFRTFLFTVIFCRDVPGFCAKSCK
jgi:hypothetical protein